MLDYRYLYQLKREENELLYKTILHIYYELSLLKLKDCPEEEFHNIPLEICDWIEKLMKIKAETEVDTNGICK